MLRAIDGGLILAATDLTNHLGCEHLTQQQLAIARGERGKPEAATDPHAELVRTRGERHEAEQLERLAAECGGYRDLSRVPTFRADQLETAATATVAAMREGAPLIYQATFFDGRWQGRADLLRRTPIPSELGDYAYEVLDTKLARQVKPGTVHQLCLYGRLSAKVQGVELPVAYVILGDGEEVPVELARYAALHRHTAQRLEQVVHAVAEETYPEPVLHCAICSLATECYRRWRRDDHLSLVAGARRDQRKRLVENGISTVLSLAEASVDDDVARLGAERFDRLHHQAALQVESRATQRPTHRQLRPERAAGYAALPTPSDGDIFFDLEGDPYVGEAGIEYLWGWWTAGGGYEYIWAHEAADEKAAFEAFIDRVVAQRSQDRGLHVYHYAPHERSKLRSLSIEYASREDEVDALLGDEVLVDLLSVVRHATQVGEESYSLKALERHYGFIRQEQRIREGGGSIVAYERWLESRDDEQLAAIRAYNEEDCRSTASLRDWLVGAMRAEAEKDFAVDFDDLRKPLPEEVYAPPTWLPAVEDLIAQLDAGLSADPAEDNEDQAARRLLGYSLLYHRREAKPEWWRYFDLRQMTVSELIDERDAVGGLQRDPAVPPIPVKRSLHYTFTFPPQEFRLDLGRVEDPISDEGFNLVALNADRAVLSRGKDKSEPRPTALVAGQPIDPAVLRKALVELATSTLAGDGRFTAAQKLLRRQPPDLPAQLLSEDPERLSEAAAVLDGTNLPIQGPPGTGKTFRAARMIVAALRAGRRVGATAQSHAAIKNLLAEVEKYAHEVEFEFVGVYKGYDYESEHRLIETVDANNAVQLDHQFVGGTAWLFAREEHREAFDLLFIDEAGQFSLANGLAAGLTARAMVFLGDPQQLPQVNQAEHPGASGASILGFLLAGENTIQPGRGVLLTESWRLHPDVCEFVSQQSYDGRLQSCDHCTRRRVNAGGGLTGTGLRALAVEHEGRSQASPEEAAAIAQACRDLLAGGTFTNENGVERALRATDLMIVAPYNLAVRMVDEAVPTGVRVGTVDRFQGQEAPVVFYAMTCSSGDEVPRGLDFLFDSHRLNVAVSRAQCLAVLVHSPRLLDADAPTLEAMALINGACRFVELAEPVATRIGSWDSDE